MNRRHTLTRVALSLAVMGLPFQRLLSFRPLRFPNLSPSTLQKPRPPPPSRS